jgi:hypothetical protein
MATLAAIRDAIKTTITDNVTGLRVHDTIPDVVNLPAVVVVPRTADFDVAMGRGIDTWEFDLFVMVSKGSTRAAQDALDAYVTGAGTSSIRQVIFTNRTLGLSNTDAHVARLIGYDLTFEASNVDHVGAALRLIVHTPGTA